MKRVWFSRDGVTHTLAPACSWARQSASRRQTGVPVTILRTGMQAYWGRRGCVQSREGSVQSREGSVQSRKGGLFCRK